MRIALRTSGGRGEYELAGKQGVILASDLFDRELFFEITPSIVIPGRAVATRVQGKPRIRLDDQTTTTHLYRVLAGILLLPKPKREFRDTHGAVLLQRDAYSMTAIKVDVGAVEQTKVVLRPTDLLLENADAKSQQLDVPARMLRITRLWDEAGQKASPLSDLVLAHMAAVIGGNADHKEIEYHAKMLATTMNTEGDILPLLEQAFGILETTQPISDRVISESEISLGEDFDEIDSTPPAVARSERIRQWRLLAIRGAAGRRFRNEITNAYNFRCMFTGQCLPRTEITDSTGVDAAHILPWSTHNNNTASNGLCLNKLCHWAFDAGVLQLSFDATAGVYVKTVTAEFALAATRAGFDIEYFRSISGPIPQSFLPANRALWPAPEYLRELNRFMETKVS